jgi:hypothetical protein
VTATGDPAVAAAPPRGQEVDFVAYGIDCVLSGRTTLEADRLTDMLNDHDEYALVGVTVDRLDGGPPMRVDEVVVPRHELVMVHATGPRGNAGQRFHTTRQHVALKLGPYRVRGFFHGMPGTNAVASVARRKTMVPLTGARIEYIRDGDWVEERVDALIVNRGLIDRLQAVEPDRAEFPADPKPAEPRSA